MKKILVLFTVLFAFTSFALAQDKQPGKKQAEIKFDQTLYDFGRFPETSPMQTCKFYFTNTGNDLLIIHQAVASCGCTVPKYPKEPIRPGERGSITVTYNGTGKAPGVFKKSVTLRTNAKTELVRLYIMGEMEEK
jgi:hypothetical protein